MSLNFLIKTNHVSEFKKRKYIYSLKKIVNEINCNKLTRIYVLNVLNSPYI